MPASQHDGMGAIPYPGGVAFRVWAPFATAVAVQVTPSGSGQATIDLTSEENEFWSTDVPGLLPGARYVFVLQNGGSLSRLDPYGQQDTNSAGSSIVYD